MAESVVSDWLDLIQEGYGSLFAAAFEALGTEDLVDLAELGGAAWVKVLANELEDWRGAGADPAHSARHPRPP